MKMTIQANKKRFPHLLVLSSLLIGFLIYNAYTTTTEDMIMNGLFNYAFHGIAIILVLFYAVIAFVDYKKSVFDKYASLTITENGIKDNLSIFSCGNISWRSISSVEIKRTLFAEVLLIKVKSPAELVKNKNAIQRYVLKQYIKKYGTPIVISDQRVRCNLQDLKKEILQHAQ